MRACLSGGELDFAGVAPLPMHIRAEWLRRSRAEDLWGTPENAFSTRIIACVPCEVRFLFKTVEKPPISFWRSAGREFPSLAFAALWRNEVTNERQAARIVLGQFRFEPWPLNSGGVMAAA